MESSGDAPDEPSLLVLTSSPDFDAAVNGIVRRVGTAANEAEVIELLGMAARRMGADVACFVSYAQEVDVQATYRCLIAGGHRWASSYVQHHRFANDPWLMHAMNSVQVVRASELQPDTAEQRAMVDDAREAGFRSTVIVPAPTARNVAQTAVLYLGSGQEGHFDGEGFVAVKVVARGLALELGAWLSRRVRDDFVARCRLTEGDRMLLRFEQQGFGSKVIAAALKTEAKTIDVRFQRLNAKLGTANRRDSLRLALLYGLL